MRLVSIRWWLPLAFTLIAAGTAAGVGVLLNQRAEAAFQARTHQLAVGDAVYAGNLLQRQGSSSADVPSVAERQNLALFIVDQHGGLLSSQISHGVLFSHVPDVSAAVAAVGKLRRYVRDTPAGGTVVGLRFPSRNAVLVAYRPSSSAAAEAAVVRHEVVRSAAIAGLGGALVGILLAGLVARRVRKIADTAAAIQSGDFSRSLQPRFPDEIGSLAAAVDQMQHQLGASFSHMEYERDRLGAILERLHDGVITVDEPGCVEYANPTAQRFAGDFQFVVGQPISEPWPDIDLRDVVREVGDAGRPVERRFRHGGRTFDLVALAPATSQRTVILVLTDVSEKERRERAEREFVANAAHELRTPTATILSSIEAIDNGGEQDPAVRRRFLGHIRREAERLARLSTAMLTLARAQTNTEPVLMSAVLVGPLLDESVAAVDLHGLQLHISCPDDLRVAANRDLAYHMFCNLLANAAKHGASSVRVEAAQNGRGVTITIRDDGPGIPKDQQERIFDRFYRGGGRDSDGFGLGLAIVREVATVLGGQVEASSSASGTTIEVTLLTWPEAE